MSDRYTIYCDYDHKVPEEERARLIVTYDEGRVLVGAAYGANDVERRVALSTASAVGMGRLLLKLTGESDGDDDENEESEVYDTGDGPDPMMVVAGCAMVTLLLVCAASMVSVLIAEVVSLLG